MRSFRPSVAAETIASLVTALTLALIPVAALGESVTINDSGDSPSYLDIGNIRFTNDNRWVTVLAQHPDLGPGRVTGVWLYIHVPKYSYTVSVNPRTAKNPRIVRSRDGADGDGTRVRCNRTRMSWQSAILGVGYIKLRIPQKCLGGADKVRMSYQIDNWKDGVYDNAPDLKADGNLNWTHVLRRG